jgi:nucleoid-associated protein YgaU
MSFTQALIEVEAQSVDASRGLPQRFSVQFNPTEYTLNKAAQIAEIAIPGIDSPILQFIRGQNEKLTLDLFFDTTKDRGMGANARNVHELTDSIYQLVKIQPKTHAPPRITFSWGQGLSFKAIVESVQQKFTLFNPEGIPLRAMLSVTFREYKTLEQQISEMNLQSSNLTKSLVVERGQTLSAIAYQEYGDAEAWRHIADANRDVIINPRRLVPGTVLVIPPLDVFGTPTVRRT